MVSLLESVYHAFSIFADWFTVQFRWLIYLIYHPFSLIDLSCEQVALLLNDLFIFNHHSFLCRLVGRRCESRFSGVRLVLGRRWANPDLRVGRLTSLLRTSGISEFWRGGWVPASACSNGLTSQRLGRRNSGATSQQRQHFLASGVKTNSGTPSQAHVFNCRAFATGGSGENDFTRSSYIFTIQVLVSCLLFRLLQRHIVITVPHNKIRHLHFSVFAFYFPTYFAFSLFPFPFFFCTDENARHHNRGPAITLGDALTLEQEIASTHGITLEKVKEYSARDLKNKKYPCTQSCALNGKVGRGRRTNSGGTYFGHSSAASHGNARCEQGVARAVQKQMRARSKKDAMQRSISFLNFWCRLFFRSMNDVETPTPLSRSTSSVLFLAKFDW